MNRSLFLYNFFHVCDHFIPIRYCSNILIIPELWFGGFVCFLSWVSWRCLCCFLNGFIYEFVIHYSWNQKRPFLMQTDPPASGFWFSGLKQRTGSGSLFMSSLDSAHLCDAAQSRGQVLNPLNWGKTSPARRPGDAGFFHLLVLMFVWPHSSHSHVHLNFKTPGTCEDHFQKKHSRSPAVHWCPTTVCYMFTLTSCGSKVIWIWIKTPAGEKAILPLFINLICWWVWFGASPLRSGDSCCQLVLYNI